MAGRGSVRNATMVAAIAVSLVVATVQGQSRARAGAAREDVRPVRIELNGSGFARGVAVITGENAARVLVDLRDLSAAVDGADRQPRLLVQHRSLFATAVGGCAGCTLRVRRPVMISAHLEHRAGRYYVPLDDVLRALEARLLVDPSGLYRIHVGRCSWCILEPADPHQDAAGGSPR